MMTDKNNTKNVILWMLVVIGILFMSVQTVSAFNVSVPAEPVNRYSNMLGTDGYTYDIYNGLSNDHKVVPIGSATIGSDEGYAWDDGTFDVFVEDDGTGPYKISIHYLDPKYEADYDSDTLNWKVPPMESTGDICNQPPYISEAQIPGLDISFDPVGGAYIIGNNPIEPQSDACFEGLTIRQSVPNGETYPSTGVDVPFNGTRYYAEIDNIPSRFPVTHPEIGGPIQFTQFSLGDTVQPGTYIIHVQNSLGMSTNAKFEIQYGDLEATLNKNIFSYGEDHIILNMKNYDSDTCYVWITGDGLNACGNNPETKEEYVPFQIPVEVCIDPATNEGYPCSSYDTLDPQALELTPGNYQFVVSSILPDEQAGQCPACGGVGRPGFCALPLAGQDTENPCPVCGVFQVLDFTIVEPKMTIDPIDPVIRCCCPGNPCGSTGGNSKIILSGVSEGDFAPDIENKTLQVWLFGESTIGGHKYLLEELPYFCDGTFEFDLNEVFFNTTYPLCSLQPGTYYVVVQQTMYNGIFDVTDQDHATNPPFTPVVGQTFVLSTMPVKWSKVFPIEGLNSYYSLESMTALEKAIDDPAIDDDYVVTSFVLQDNACAKSVDFTGTPQKGLAPMTVSFQGNATYPITNWNWDFGDGNVSSEQNPTHTYLNAGYYSVILSVNNGERQNQKFSYIHTLDSLKAVFQAIPLSLYRDQEVQFKDLSTGNPTSWLWDFDDGQTTNLQSPVHTYTEPGSYNVSLTVSNEYGLSSVSSQTILVMHDQPVAAFSASRTETKTYPAQINFLDESTGGGLTSWLWDFGDNSTSTNENPSHLYVQPGNFSVSLTVKNDGGTNTTKKEDYISIGPIYSPEPNPKPVSFSAIPTLGNTPLLVNFTDTSDMAGVNWSWDFGDGGVSDEQDPGYVYETKGTYSVTLLVDDGTSTNTTTMKDYITVVDVPIVDFSFKPVTDYTDKDIQFTDQSTGNPTSWMWDFDDGSTSSLQSPVHSFAEAGTYSVTLTVSNAYGIGTPVTKDIVIMNDGPVAAFTANPQNSTSYPAEVYFTDQSIGDGINAWVWDFGDGSTSTTKSPIHMYLLPGLFNVTLIVSNNGGSDVLTKVNYITIGGQPGDIYTLTIYPDWNHFSIPAPLVEEKNTVAEVFEGIDRGVEPAYIFSAETQDYEAISDDTVLEPLTMYKIWYNKEDQTKVEFEYANWNSTFTKDLKTGWNGIGLTGPVPVPASEALKSLGDSWDKLIWYDGSKQDWIGPVERGKTDYTLLYPVKGYMVDMNADATLEG